MITSTLAPVQDLNLLRTFLAVHRAGSFTGAAPALGLTQPSVTAQIRSLEEQLGRQLFQRLPRGVEPTPFARELAERISGPLDDLDVVAGGNCELDGRTAPVHLAGPPELLCSRILPVLAPLVAEGLRVHVATGEDEELIEQLREGRHDLVITTQRPRGRALAVTPWAQEEHLLVAAPGWAARVGSRAEGVPVCAALEAVPLVSTADDMPVVRRYWRTQYGKQHPAVGPAMTVPSLHAVITALREGAGYSVLPRSLCAADLAAGALVQLEEPERPRSTTLLLVQRPGAEQNPATAQVAEALRRAVRTPEDLHPTPA
ncbi:LysR family transcriptional regulator [Brachybacterium saurashtrense]|uniref:LysR family transcriptional regulator n=1 Tax=Brachybacterium saurashtrense TaxID=556288 RepID=A0A345YNE4_9MICO|nr:LysR family transcriptional regulator [Brachybacterium saurashtrense]AXK45446.1 LysR family transcriptional regulator [Brachybacterium saurashtrense]RRR21181.1 LysR family transcriptional regulator [Brachybacterium saurashtrense]